MNYSIQLDTIQFSWTQSFKGDEGLILFVCLMCVSCNFRDCRWKNILILLKSFYMGIKGKHKAEQRILLEIPYNAKKIRIELGAKN